MGGKPVWDPPLLFLLSTGVNCCTAVWAVVNSRPNTSFTVTLELFIFLFTCKPTVTHRVRLFETHSLSAVSSKCRHCTPIDLSFSVLSVCLIVSVCVRATFRWLLPPPGAPTQLQLPAGCHHRLHSLVDRPGTPAWRESSWIALYINAPLSTVHVAIGQVWVMAI